MTGLRRAAAMSCVVFMVAACSSGSPTPTPTPGASTLPSATDASEAPASVDAGSAAPSGPAPLGMGVLAAGTYTTTQFEPALTFDLAEGWHQYFADDSDEIALGGPDVDLNMTRPAQVIDPTSGQPADSPDSLADWVAGNANLDASAPTTVQIAGIESTYFDLPGPTSTVQLFHYTSGDMHIPPGTQTRIYVVPMDGPDLVLVMYATSSDFAAAVEAVQPIVDSLQIAPE